MNTKQEAKEYIRDCALLTDYGRELMTTLLKELEAHYESWKQHMDVSVNNARYIVELEMKLEATERKLAEAEKVVEAAKIANNLPDTENYWRLNKAISDYEASKGDNHE